VRSLSCSPSDISVCWFNGVHLCVIHLGNQSLKSDFVLNYAESNSLLAERTYVDIEPRIVWNEGKAYYGADDEYIALPSSRLGWLRVHMP
jgi:hypothetical protein